MNKVMLEGRIIKVSEIENRGNFIIREITLRMDREYKGTTYSDIIPLTMFGDMATNFSLPVGYMAAVTGRVKGREYTDKNGSSRVFVSISISDIHSIEGAEKQKSASSQAKSRQMDIGF